MGRIVEAIITGLKCNNSDCEEIYTMPPVSIKAHWSEQAEEMREAIWQGWTLIMSPKMRSYCPNHQETAKQCSCRWQYSRRDYCPKHSPYGRLLVWNSHQTPEEVKPFLTTKENQNEH